MARPTIVVEASPNLRILADKFLAWVLTHRGEKAHIERSRHISRFNALYGHFDASAIEGKHLETFIETLTELKYEPDYIHKHVISVKAMFNKAVKKGWLPPTVRPFEGVEAVRLTPKALTEAKLPTDEEVQRLFVSADADPSKQMGDLIRLYHATGARTGELIAMRAGDFQPNNRQVILAKHKRSHTLRQPVPRTITLNATACEILARRTEPLMPDAFVFTRPRDHQPFTNLNIAMRFQTIRRRAKVRESLSVYSLRHLWISEALMAGLDLLLVARMAGTGVKMIESTYGHFRSQSYHDAQARLDAARAARASL